MPNLMTVLCRGTGRPERAHCLPHADHRTLRQHEYLFYAGLLQSAGGGQRQFKGCVQNICWLDRILHDRMDAMDAFVWMAEVRRQYGSHTAISTDSFEQLEEVIASCEQHLAVIEQGGGHGFETFQSSSFLQDWSTQMGTGAKNIALFRYRPWVLPRQTMEEHKEDNIWSLNGRDYRSYALSKEYKVFPPPAPFKYTTPLPSRLLSLDPFIATLMAMTTLERRPDYGDIAFDEEARVMLQRAEYLLELCEVDTPSSWRTLARPPLTTPPPSSSATHCPQRRLFQAMTYERQQAKRGRKSGDSEASSSRGRRPRMEGGQGEAEEGPGQPPTGAAEQSRQVGSGQVDSGREDSRQGQDSADVSGQGLDSAMSSPKEAQGTPDLSFSVSTHSSQSGPRSPTASEQWHTWSPPGKPSLRRETSLTLTGIQSLTMQETMANEGDSDEGTPTPDCLKGKPSQEELGAQLERLEEACEAERRAYLQDCSAIIERHFRADCDARGFALAMRSLRRTAKHPADDELAAKQKTQEEQEESFRQRRFELSDAIDEVRYH